MGSEARSVCQLRSGSLHSSIKFRNTVVRTLVKCNRFVHMLRNCNPYSTVLRANSPSNQPKVAGTDVKFSVSLSLSLSLSVCVCLSLSLSHTHTHTHTLRTRLPRVRGCALAASICTTPIRFIT
jgi:hypothetical protein